MKLKTFRNIKEMDKRLDEREQEITELNENITWWQNRFKAVERDNRQLKEEKKKAREFIYRYWITYDESKNFTEFNEEMNILIKDIKKLLEILGDKE